VAAGRQPATIRSYLYNAGGFARWCSERRVSPWRASRRHIASYFLDQASTASRSTAVTRLMAVRSLYQFAIGAGLCLADPTAGFSGARPKLDDPRPYRDLEIERLLSVTVEARLRALLYFALGSACRREEIVGLDVEDIDWTSGIVRIRMGKGAKERYVAPGRAALAAVHFYLDGRRKGPVFLADSGARLPGHRAYMMLRRVREEAGVVGATLHKFRVTAANWLSDKGMELDELQEIMGHADIATTARYAGWSKRERALRKQSALSLADRLDGSG